MHSVHQSWVSSQFPQCGIDKHILSYLKCKFSPRSYTFDADFRRERALNRSIGKAVLRAGPAAAALTVPQSPSSTWSPTPSPTSPLPTHVYYAPIMDEPIALIKKPRKDADSAEEKTKSTTTSQIQVLNKTRVSQRSTVTDLMRVL